MCFCQKIQKNGKVNKNKINMLSLIHFNNHWKYFILITILDSNNVT